MHEYLLLRLDAVLPGKWPAASGCTTRYVRPETRNVIERQEARRRLMECRAARWIQAAEPSVTVVWVINRHQQLDLFGQISVDHSKQPPAPNMDNRVGDIRLWMRRIQGIRLQHIHQALRRRVDDA